MEVKEEEIDDEDFQKYCAQTTCYVNDPLVMVQPYQQIYMKGYVDNYHEKLQNFQCYDDDVFVATHPKTGTTWMQELLWTIRNNPDLKKVNVDIEERVPYIDEVTWSHSDDTLVSAEKLTRPRILKTHLSYDMLPNDLRQGKGKIINVIRNPRDVCLSLFNHERIIYGYNGDLGTLVDMFTRDLGPVYSPYMVHVMSYWKRRSEVSNMLNVTYEEMQADLSSVIVKVAKFINVDVRDEDMPKICNHLSFDSMKSNPMVNNYEGIEERKKAMNNKDKGVFINKGKVGRWKTEMTPEMIKKFTLYEERWLKDSDLKFTFEL